MTLHLASCIDCDSKQLQSKGANHSKHPRAHAHTQVTVKILSSIAFLLDAAQV